VLLAPALTLYLGVHASCPCPLQVGYYANVTRLHPCAHRGALNLLMKTAIDVLKAEQQQLAAPLDITQPARQAGAGAVRRARCKVKSKARVGGVGATPGPAGGVCGGEGSDDTAGPLPLPAPLIKDGSIASSFASSRNGSGAWVLSTECEAMSPRPAGAGGNAQVGSGSADMALAVLPVPGGLAPPPRRPLVVNLGMAPLCALREDPALHPNPHMARQLARGFSSSITGAFYPYKQVCE
jgi:hypothetical protein